MSNPNEITTDSKMSKDEVLSEIHKLTIEGIRLIAKNNEDEDMGFEQYFLSMLELQTRPFSDGMGQQAIA